MTEAQSKFRSFLHVVEFLHSDALKNDQRNQLSFNCLQFHSLNLAYFDVALLGLYLFLTVISSWDKFFEGPGNTFFGDHSPLFS